MSRPLPAGWPPYRLGSGIDLHTHSTASDGTVDPARIGPLARDAGLSVVALTDHDTTAGWGPAAAALPAGVTLVRGAEISCRWESRAGAGVGVHLLAYLFDPTEPTLAAIRQWLRTARAGRARQIVDRLAAAGFGLDWEQVLTIAARAPVGRPHIARALVEIGVVPDVPTAFASLLRSDSPYYVPKADAPVAETIAAVRRAGGAPVIAHARAARRGPALDDAALQQLAAAGLAGVEVDHPDHTAAERADLRAIAAAHALLITGSSDFHGSNKPANPLGAETTSPAAFDAMVAACSGIPLVAGSG